jgi:hypothetical protein
MYRQVLSGDQAGGNPGLEERGLACARLGVQRGQWAALQMLQEFADGPLAPEKDLRVAEAVFDQAFVRPSLNCVGGLSGVRAQALGKHADTLCQMFRLEFLLLFSLFGGAQPSLNKGVDVLDDLVATYKVAANLYVALNVGTTAGINGLVWGVALFILPHRLFTFPKAKIW